MSNVRHGRAWVIWVMIAGFLLCGVVSASATTYYIAANGSDSNDGRSIDTPWLHAPGMPTCTNTCASTTPQAGDRFIFRGGDTWHFGNSSATPYTGGTWTISWGGHSGNLIYFGVNTGWYAGTSWSRPIMDGDNPASTSAVASCAYNWNGREFIDGHQGMLFDQLDNLEFKGFCWDGSTQGGYINWSCGLSGEGACGNVLSNLYVHGWTHTAFNCASGGTCDSSGAINGTSQNNTGGGDVITGLVCDGADSDPSSFGCIGWDCYDVEYSVLRNASQGAVCNNMHIWHDVLVENIHKPGDGHAHGNGFEFNNEWSATAGAPNYVYNIIVRNSTTAVTTWVCPHYSDVYWNWIVYNNYQQAFDIDTGCGNPNIYLYNMTFADSGTVGANTNWGGYLKNVLLIGSGTNVIGTPASQSNVITMTDAQATTAGFTSSSVYAYQPQSGTCNGQSSPTCPINNGSNLASVWPSGFVTNDTSYACMYNTSTHSVSCPARASVARPSTGNWDVGAYQFGTTTSTSPQPPTGLSVVVH
jgi:hypothetical protein